MRKIIAYKNEHGAALIGALLLVVLVGTSLVLRQLSRADIDVAREQTTHIALKAAKEALIAYAATSNTPGRLPCPEDTSRIGFPTEGSELSSCSNVAPTIGRLPWYSLKLEKMLDGHGEPLWYALSPGFRAEPLNSETPGQLMLDSRTDIVALILAPGPALSGQSRTLLTTSTPPDPANYLDVSNKDGNPKFISASTTNSLNDRVIAITHAELFAQVELRVARDVRYAMLEHFCGVDNVNTNAGKCLAAGGVRSFPAPAATGDTSCLGKAQYSIRLRK